MKIFKSIIYTFSLFVLLVSFSECSSAQKLQERAPIAMNQVYVQNWTAGVEGGGSGYNLFIPFQKEMPSTIVLDSIYFKGRTSAIEKIEGQKFLYVARFIKANNQKPDIIMSSDSKEEYGNKFPSVIKQKKYNLKDNEAILSYYDGAAFKLYKIENIVERPLEHLPNTPPHQR